MQDSTETPQSDPVDDGSIAECVNESNSILSTTEGDEPLSTSLDPDILPTAQMDERAEGVLVTLAVQSKSFPTDQLPT